MNRISERPPKQATKTRFTPGRLANELATRSQRLQDFEDLRELDQAIERNESKPLTSWAKTKKELGLELE